MFISEEGEWSSSLSSPFLDKGQGEFGPAGLAGENGVAAVLRYTPLSVQTHPAEELLQTAVRVHRRREAAGHGNGGGGTAEQLQSLLLRGAGDGRGG